MTMTTVLYFIKLMTPLIVRCSDFRAVDSVVGEMSRARMPPTLISEMLKSEEKPGENVHH